MFVEELLVFFSAHISGRNLKPCGVTRVAERMQPCKCTLYSVHPQVAWCWYMVECNARWVLCTKLVNTNA